MGFSFKKKIPGKRNDIDCYKRKLMTRAGFLFEKKKASGIRIGGIRNTVKLKGAQAQFPPAVSSLPAHQLQTFGYFTSPRIFSYCDASEIIFPSCRWSAKKRNPTGKPFANPHGTEIWGMPTRFGGFVRMSA